MDRTYCPKVYYHKIPCQLLYADKDSCFYSDHPRWLLIADETKRTADLRIPKIILPICLTALFAMFRFSSGSYAWSPINVPPLAKIIFAFLILSAFPKAKEEKLDALGFEYKNNSYILETDEDTAMRLFALADAETKRMNELLKALLVPVIYFVCLIFFWQLPIHLQIASLDLPPGTETVYPTKAHISDVYWLHIKAEKVIRCEDGWEEAKKYIEDHNSALKRWHIDIYEYAGMSDIAVYDSDFDDDFWKLDKAERNRYAKISYFKLLDVITITDILTLFMLIWFFGVLIEMARTSIKSTLA